MKILYLDCFSGISGDMTLGALLDLGLDHHTFLSELNKLGLEGYDIEIKKGVKNGITGLDVKVNVHNEISDSHRHLDEENEHVDENCQGHMHSGHQVDVRHHSHEHHHQHHHEHEGRHKEGEHHEHHQDGGHHEHDHVHHQDGGHHGQYRVHPHTCSYPHSHVHSDGHFHHWYHHSHNGKGTQRNFRQIKELIESSTLSESVKQTALRIFERLAMAEGKIHGVSLEQVHFHEVGAVDSIVDIVGTAICIDMLKPDVILASAVHVGGGLVKCQHGIFPVPAPATLELLKGIPVYSKGYQGELVTPTGAAILSSLCSEFVDFPAMVVDKIGYGLGKKNYEIPNCLRACWGESLKK
jgi:hypothetical protein